MENRITIREAVTENDVAAFWEQLHAYHKRDIFPDSDDDELEYFLGSGYHDRMMEIYSRPQDRCFHARALHFRGRQVLHHGILRLSGVSRERNRQGMRRSAA